MKVSLTIHSYDYWWMMKQGQFKGHPYRFNDGTDVVVDDRVTRMSDEQRKAICEARV